MRATNYFAVVPEWVLDSPEISDAGVRLYAILRRYADQSDTAWPSVPTLAERLQKSDRQVRRLLKELEEAEAVEILAAWGEGGKQLSNRYRLRAEPPKNWTQMSWGADMDDSHVPDTDVSQTKAIGTKASIDSNPDNGDPLFEAVVEAWLPGHYEPGQKLTTSERGRVNKALVELRRIDATPEDVIEAFQAHRARWPGMTATPQSVLRNWNTLHAPLVEGKELIHEHEWELQSIDDDYFYRCAECGVQSANLTGIR